MTALTAAQTARLELAEQLLDTPASKVVRVAEDAAERCGGVLRHPPPHLGMHIWRFDALGISGTGVDDFAAVMHWCRQVKAAEGRAA